MTFLDLQSLMLLGFLGTGHCIGMCGPLVVAFPGQSTRFVSHLWYHAGRLVTYTLIGFTMGSIGFGVGKLAGAAASGELIWISRVQVGLSFFAAAFLLVFGMTRIGLIREPAWLAVASPSRIPGFGSLVRSVSRTPSDAGLLIVGFAMGFLPCGLSYAAFARAVAATEPIHGAVMTFCFGLGTLPGLLVLGTGASAIAQRYRRHLDLLSGVLMVAMAVKIGAGALAAAS